MRMAVSPYQVKHCETIHTVAPSKTVEFIHMGKHIFFLLVAQEVSRTGIHAV